MTKVSVNNIVYMDLHIVKQSQCFFRRSWIIKKRLIRVMVWSIKKLLLIIFTHECSFWANLVLLIDEILKYSIFWRVSKMADKPRELTLKKFTREQLLKCHHKSNFSKWIGVNSTAFGWEIQLFILPSGIPKTSYLILCAPQSSSTVQNLKIFIQAGP